MMVTIIPDPAETMEQERRKRLRDYVGEKERQLGISSGLLVGVLRDSDAQPFAFVTETGEQDHYLITLTGQGYRFAAFSAFAEILTPYGQDSQRGWCTTSSPIRGYYTLKTLGGVL